MCELRSDVVTLRAHQHETTESTSTKNNLKLKLDQHFGNANSFRQAHKSASKSSTTALDGRLEITTMDDGKAHRRNNRKVHPTGAQSLNKQQVGSSSSSSSSIRSRYLHRLGVVGNSSSQNKPKIHRPLVPAGPLVEVLKNDHGTQDEDLTVNSPPSCSPIGSRSVSFQSAVVVHQIPKRKEYSERVRQSMWMHPQEMHECVARNILEFSAENWDWRQATEEQDMIVHKDMLIHPIHFMRRCNMQRHFTMVMSAQCHTN